ncbi:hypothetical protein [Halorussus sp. AFM4]|uniref:hypothetical protein n=1 Tax=Halorussus sp. AFM4 TaxID=3421651 RepID=UPI003EBE05F9
MDRREYLATAASAASAVAIAGCSGGSGSGDGTTTAETTTSADAQQHLSAAGEALRKAGEELSAQSDRLEEADMTDGVDVRTESLDGYLDTAASELDAAEESATDPQRERIAAARGYVSFARKFGEFLDVFAEGYTRLGTGLTYFKSKRFEDAAGKLETARKTISRAEDVLAVLRDRAEKLDTDTLSELERVDVESMQTGLATLDELVPVLTAFADGLRDVSLGMVDFKAANAKLGNDEFETSERRFAAAKDHFASGYQTFKKQEESAPASVESSVVQLTCYAKALRDASEHFAATAEALANGNNERAKSEAEKGKQAANRCSFDV